MLVLSACATGPKSLEPEQRAKINKIFVFISDAGQGIRIIDHTGVQGTNGVATQVGVAAENGSNRDSSEAAQRLWFEANIANQTCSQASVA